MVKVQGLRSGRWPPQREWFEKDYYKVLGVPGDAPRRRRSPRRTASWRASTTPTPTRATPSAEERFKEISAAYDVVGDEAKRKEYDEVRKLGPMGALFGGGPGGPQGARVASRSTSTTATSATCSAACSGGGRRRGGAGAAASGPAGATTSRPSCTCRSPTPSTASPPR